VVCIAAQQGAALAAGLWPHPGVHTHASTSHSARQDSFIQSCSSQSRTPVNQTIAQDKPDRQLKLLEPARQEELTRTCQATNQAAKSRSASSIKSWRAFSSGQNCGASQNPPLSSVFAPGCILRYCPICCYLGDASGMILVPIRPSSHSPG
jgi:hypothetical protein